MRLAPRSLAAIAFLSLAACATGTTTSTSTSTMTPGMSTAAVSDAARAVGAANAQSAGMVVILVRHAERATDSPTDPSLTPDGERRAQALAAALRDAGITHVVTTEYRRTQLTAAPLAAALGLTAEVVRTQGSTPHVLAMASAVRAKGPNAVVLVVGHSNTVPAYVAALGGPQPAAICDAGYDNLFVLSTVNGTQRLVRAKYGAASPEC